MTNFEQFETGIRNAFDVSATTNPSVNIEPLSENLKQVLDLITINPKITYEQLAERIGKNRDTFVFILNDSVQNITCLTASEPQRTVIGLFFSRWINNMRKFFYRMNQWAAKYPCHNSIFIAGNLPIIKDYRKINNDFQLIEVC